METNKLYYEVLDVTDGKQIKKAYDYVVANNIKFYRCVSKTNKKYYWNGKTYKILSSENEWAENPTYKEPVDIVENLPDKNKFALNHTVESDELNNVNDNIHSEKKNGLQNITIDYESLYLESKELLKATQDEAANNLKLYFAEKERADELENQANDLQEELNEIYNAFYIIKNILQCPINSSEK